MAHSVPICVSTSQGKQKVKSKCSKTNHDISLIVPVPNRTIERNKVTVWSPIGQFSLSHSLSKPIYTIWQYLQLFWLIFRVMHQENGQKKSCTNHQEAWKACGRSNDALPRTQSLCFFSHCFRLKQQEHGNIDS
jgi:hypothetical protein